MSAVVAPRVGEVIPYWYLWWREHERGEDSGRKARPCVVIAAAGPDANRPLLAVLPLTTSPPSAERTAVEMPSRIKQHLGLDGAQVWVVCDEQNEFQWPGFDIARTRTGAPSFGGVPDRFLAMLIEAHREARLRGKLKSAPRDD